MSRVVLPVKLVGEQEIYPFDFISKLSAGETILTQTVTISVYSGTDASPSALLIGAASASGTVVSQEVGGGLAGVIYKLVCTITTSGGQTLILPAYLAVVTPEVYEALYIKAGSAFSSVTVTDAVTLARILYGCGASYSAMTMPHAQYGVGFCYSPTLKRFVASQRLPVSSHPAWADSTAPQTWAEGTGTLSDVDYAVITWNPIAAKFVGWSASAKQVESTDGKAWTENAIVTSAPSPLNRFGGLYVSNTYADKYISFHSLNLNKFWTSADGISWTERTQLPSTACWQVCAKDDTNIVVLAGYSTGADNKFAYHSLTNWYTSAWTGGTLPATQLWDQIVNNGRCFFGMSSTKTDTVGARSYDHGATWESVTVPTTVGARGVLVVRSNGALQFADQDAGTNLGYCSNDDGTTWSSFAIPSSGGSWFWSGGSIDTDQMFTFSTAAQAAYSVN